MPETNILLWGLLFGSIGFGYFIYGKKQSHLAAKYSGIALMIYPYMVQDTLAIIAIGIALMLLPKWL